MRKFVGLLCGVVLVLGFSVNASALSYTATLTADNYYALYVGTEDDLELIGRNELGTSGDPGTYNWSKAETFDFDLAAGESIYVVGWSDGSVAQGWIGQFVSEYNMLLTNTSDWEVYLSNSDLGNGDDAPDLEAKFAEGEETWNAVTDSIAHGSGPWGYIDGISHDASWIWGSPLQPGSNYGEYQVFRITPNVVPEPGTVVLIGIGLLGLAIFRKRNGK